MNTLNHLRATGGGMVKRMFLIGSFVSVLLLIARDIVWLYANFESGMGTRMAQVAISYHIALLIGMLTVGVGLGHMINRMIREKRSIFESPRKGGKTEKIMKLWGYELCEETNISDEPNIEIPIDPPIMDTFAIMDIPTTPRRGRKPAFTVDRWVPIAQKWEFRDPIRDSFTLGELICEHLGKNDDGSPIISEQTYYSVWKDRAMEEIQRIEARKKAMASSYKKERIR